MVGHIMGWTISACMLPCMKEACSCTHLVINSFLPKKVSNQGIPVKQVSLLWRQIIVLLPIQVQHCCVLCFISFIVYWVCRFQTSHSYISIVLSDAI